MYFIAQATTQTTQVEFNEGNIMGSDVKIRLKTVRGAIKKIRQYSVQKSGYINAA